MVDLLVVTQAMLVTQAVLELGQFTAPVISGLSSIWEVVVVAVTV